MLWTTMVTVPLKIEDSDSNQVVVSIV